jgi:DNA-directed RNA polymerase subunit RPC12/RpoP
MIQQEYEESFTCIHCGTPVSVEAWGTRHRNHCPYCLWSRHVDIKPGDRSCLCGGPMEPIALWQKNDGEIMILHRCRQCGTIKANRSAGDDSQEMLDSLIPWLPRENHCG